jgi:SulP family sulfate permease
MALFTALVVGVFVSLTSSYRGTVAIPQDRIAPILALVASVIAARMSGATPEQTFATVVLGIALCTLGAGILLSVLGTFRLGNLIRFIPMPVVGGFLAGSGWLLLKGSLRVMTGELGGWSDLPRLVAPETLVDWGPGALLGIVLFITLRLSRRALTLPVMLLGAVALFYAILAVADISVVDARLRGWLPQPIESDGVWKPVTLAVLGQADWTVLLGQIGSFATVFVVSVVSILLNASALEYATGKEIDLNRELRVTGVANLITGLGGGMVGFHSLSLSGLVHRMGVQSRVAGLTAALLAGLTLLLGGSALSYFPLPVLGGLLFLLGMSFLVDWLYDAWFRLPRTDYLTVLLILAVIGTIGYMEGVGVGIIAAVLFFVVKYSRINVVRNDLTGAYHRSNVDRPRHHLRVLEQKGEQILILELQGFIFFGTANNLLNRVRDRVVDTEADPLRFLVLDFRRVTGLDSSAILSLTKMRDLGKKEGFIIVLTHVSRQVNRLMAAVGIEEKDAAVLMFVDLDHGVEWCENEVLHAEVGEDEGEAISLRRELAAHCRRELELSMLMEYFERSEVEAGVTLLEQGDVSNDLLYLEAGQVTVWLGLGGGRKARLRSMRAGTVVGELGMVLGERRTATVTTDGPSIVYRLSTEALERMREEHPELAAAFHEFLIKLLAERLVHSNRALQALTD